MSMDEFIAIMPKNQCVNCGNWYSDELKEKHNCEEVNNIWMNNK